MNLERFSDAASASSAAAERLCAWLAETECRNLMVAGGNSPLPLYERVAERLSTAEASARGIRERLRVFVLDEYVGVPAGHPRTTTELLRRVVQDAWGLPAGSFFGLSPRPDDALARLHAHERAVEAAGGLGAIVLGLGVNGHLGFNEPGSAPDSAARLVELQPASVEANRAWFAGTHAPSVGATVGLRTILAARRVLLVAFGEAKAEALRAMARGPVAPQCPASFLQQHPQAHVFVDAAAMLRMRAT